MLVDRAQLLALTAPDGDFEVKLTRGGLLRGPYELEPKGAVGSGAPGNSGLGPGSPGASGSTGEGISSGAGNIGGSASGGNSTGGGVQRGSGDAMTGLCDDLGTAMLRQPTVAIGRLRTMLTKRYHSVAPHTTVVAWPKVRMMVATFSASSLSGASKMSR